MCRGKSTILETSVALDELRPWQKCYVALDTEPDAFPLLSSKARPPTPPTACIQLAIAMRLPLPVLKTDLCLPQLTLHSPFQLKPAGGYRETETQVSQLGPAMKSQRHRIPSQTIYSKRVGTLKQRRLGQKRKAHLVEWGNQITMRKYCKMLQ